MYSVNENNSKNALKDTRLNLELQLSRVIITSQFMNATPNHTLRNQTHLYESLFKQELESSMIYHILRDHLQLALPSVILVFG